ncbi:MAG: competence/damage-inducible protein A [Candidatus Rokubacteria bacterium]|nr:competence/damage-inducible protein A [Candidatus Rokubacteria bacterium]
MAKTAGIVLIGNEILSGKISDANAAYLCRELRALGVEVRKISVIPDEVEAIAREVARFVAGYDYVFTSGGVGPTHDDVTIDGVSRALGVAVARHPRLVALLESFYKGKLNAARLKMAEVPEGSELLAADSLIFPVIVIGNVYILPGVPEIFRQKFEAIKERFREQPFFLRSVFVRIGEGTLADFLNDLLKAYPLLMLGSYPEFSHPDYKVKVTLESKDREYLDHALAEFVDRLPQDAVVRVE